MAEERSLKPSSCKKTKKSECVSHQVHSGEVIDVECHFMITWLLSLKGWCASQIVSAVDFPVRAKR